MGRCLLLGMALFSLVGLGRLRLLLGLLLGRLLRLSLALGSTGFTTCHNTSEVLSNDNGIALGGKILDNDASRLGSNGDVNLVRLNAGKLLVGLDCLANLLGQAGQCALVKRLGHRGHPDDFFAIEDSREAKEAPLGVDCAALAEEGVGVGSRDCAREAGEASDGLESNSRSHLY